MRLIDADRFKAYMLEEYICYDHTLADIDAQPTVDVEPIKHGHWIIDRHNIVTTCNSCGWSFRYFDGLEEDWICCPHCGTKMDEDIENGI